MSAIKPEMKQIKEEICNLVSSPLYTYRLENKYFPVVGEGSHSAEIVFIGEAPGENEAKTGRPFCGRAGAVLDSMLLKSQLNRDEVYITNIVKDRPPKNRDPLPEEISLYGPYLDRQLKIIKPKVVATLGRFSMQYIMNQYGLQKELASISLIHGRVFEAKASWGTFKVVPLYHPAATIYNRELLTDLEKDFLMLKNI